MFELKGSLKVVEETNVISEKFKKREFVITDDSSQDPHYRAMQL
jgi:hypothetical protein